MLAAQGHRLPARRGHDPFRLLRVGFRHRVDDWSVDALFRWTLGQRTRLRRQARAANTWARSQVCPTDAGVQADAVDDHRHVGSGCCRESGKLVGEAGLQPKKDVRAGLDQLRRGGVGDEYRRPDIEVDALQQRQRPGLGLWPGQADDDSIRSQEVTNGVALARELRIDCEFHGRIGSLGDTRHARGLGRHEGAAHDDRPRRVLVGHDICQSALDVACTPVAALVERADAQEHRVRSVAERSSLEKRKRPLAAPS